MSRDPNVDAPASKPAAGLYLVATPIGNLGDITRRAVDLLRSVDTIAAEDTRVARRLLSALGITGKQVVRYDDHADDHDRDRLIATIQGGGSVALISDAGMPLVADPGLKLVRAAHAAGVATTAAPGASAALTALALSGLPSDRFLFQGFLPAKDGARRSVLEELKSIPATLVFFESPHRLADSLAAMADILGAREAAIARELTKLFEEIRRGDLPALAAAYAAAETPKGEIVIVVAPPAPLAATAGADLDAMLADALARLSVRDAVAEIAEATGAKRGEVYARALALKNPR